MRNAPFQLSHSLWRGFKWARSESRFRSESGRGASVRAACSGYLATGYSIRYSATSSWRSRDACPAVGASTPSGEVTLRLHSLRHMRRTPVVRSRRSVLGARRTPWPELCPAGPQGWRTPPGGGSCPHEPHCPSLPAFWPPRCSPLAVATPSVPSAAVPQLRSLRLRRRAALPLTSKTARSASSIRW